MKTCTVDGCSSGSDKKGLCNKHYLRLWRHGSVLKRERPINFCVFPGCKNKRDARGYCKAHYGRLRRTGRPEGTRTAYDYDAHKWVLDHLYYEGSGCLEWPYGKNAFGYGLINIDGRPISVHTLMTTILHGPRPSDYHQAAHSCGNGHLGCVNPKHLRWATRLENEADKLVHGTYGKKLSAESVLEIASIGDLTHREIAGMFGVSRSIVTGIKSGKIWGRVTGIK